MSDISSFEDSASPSDGSLKGTYDPPKRKPLRSKHMTPLSPRKRARSPSEDQLRARKRHLDGKYNDAYRTVYNDTVTDAATRFVTDPLFRPQDAVIGVSKWSAREKTVFFAALDRLGRDDLPGIAKAIGTKSIFETKQFLLLVQEAFLSQDLRRRKARIALQDIPAALEIGPECGDSLELAADALAWYQERFEAKLEQERYGDYWLITPTVAEEIDMSMTGSDSVPATPDVRGDKSGLPVLQQIPEAELLDPGVLLHLSKYYFMNPSPTINYPWPHWSELTTELAAEPSIYRSAFIDLHTLVVSLTKRILQTAIIQTTSRIRTHGWRTKNGVDPHAATHEWRTRNGIERYVRRQDVLTAIDILGLSRNSRERWRGVARRCGLRVKGAITRVGGRGGKRKVEVTWNDVERLLLKDKGLRVVPSDGETPGLTSGTDEDMSKAQALRAGTPRPVGQPASTFDSDADSESHISHAQPVESDSDEYRPLDDPGSDTSMLDGGQSEAELLVHATDEELDDLEGFDQAARMEEERELFNLLHQSTPRDHESPKPKAESVDPETKKSTRTVPADDPHDDWHNWIQYRAPWEQFQRPLPSSSFQAPGPTEGHMDRNAPGYETSHASGMGYSTEQDDEKRQIRSQRRTELPIRGARAYAAMQDRMSVFHDEDPSADHAKGDEGIIPTKSTESEHGEAMDLD